MIRIVRHFRAVIEQSRKETSGQVIIPVITETVFQLKRTSQPYILGMIIEQFLQPGYIPIGQILRIKNPAGFHSARPFHGSGQKGTVDA